MTPVVLAVHRSPRHTFSKEGVARIRLVEGHGVEGDAHAGATVRHRYLARQDASAPNFRQVHLIHAELFDLVAAEGFRVLPGQLGENITTAGLDLLALPVGTRLAIGDAEVTLTGLRDPCRQIDALAPGLRDRLRIRRPDGGLERLAGVMGVVSRGGTVQPGDPVGVELPAVPHTPLRVV